MSLYLKIIGAVCITLCATGTGFYLSEKLRQRKIFLDSFCRFLTILDTSIRYDGGEIITLIKKSAPAELKALFDFNNSDFRSVWLTFIENIPKSKGLKDEDYRLIYDFGDKLGATDVEGQLNHIRLYSELFKNSLDNSLSEYKSKSKLYKLLGFFTGAVLSIMII